MAQLESAVSDTDWVDVASEHAELAGDMSSSTEEDLLLLFENQRWCVTFSCRRRGCAANAALRLHAVPAIMVPFDLVICFYSASLLCWLYKYNKQVRRYRLGRSHCYRPLSVEQWPRLSRLGHVVCAVRVSLARRVYVCIEQCLWPLFSKDARGGIGY